MGGIEDESNGPKKAGCAGGKGRENRQKAEGKTRADLGRGGGPLKKRHEEGG